MLTEPPICQCGTYAIGVCQECKSPVCGAHSAMVDERRICFADRRRLEHERTVAVSARREEAERALRDTIEPGSIGPPGQVAACPGCGERWAVGRVDPIVRCRCGTIFNGRS